MNYILYGTLGCHLCEDALGLLKEAQQSYSFTWEETDIADDAILEDRYGVSIPVLFHPLSQKGLYWPFDQTSLHTFLLETA
jgi:Glutaredoxin-like domain (DUF836)